MQKYKLFLFLFLSVFVFSSCISDKAPPSDSGCDGNFIVERVTGTLRISEESALPDKFTLDLKACMRPQALRERTLPSTFWSLSLNKGVLPQDRKTTQDIETARLVSENLEVSKNINQFIYLKTDGDGCLKWTETYDYAYSKKSHWIVIDRYIRGNEYIGTCQIPLAINPWLQKENLKDIQVVDYRPEYKDKSKDIQNYLARKKCDQKDKKKCPLKNGWNFLKEQKLAEKDNKVDIMVKTLTFHRSATDSQTSYSLLKGISIKANFGYHIMDIDNKLNYNSITTGTFKIIPHLLSRDSTVAKSRSSDIEDSIDNNNTIYKYRWIDELIFDEDDFDRDISINFASSTWDSESFKWKVPYVNYGSQLFLYLKVIPQKDTANKINPFEGIYKLADNFNILNTQSPESTTLLDILEKKYHEKNQVEEEEYRKKQEKYKAEIKNNAHIIMSQNDSTKCLKNWVIGSIDSLFDTPCILPTRPNTKTDGYRSTGWNIERMNVKFLQVETENWLSRQIESFAESVVLNSAQEPQGNKSIIITVTDLSTGKKDIIDDIKTNNNGEFTFNIPTWHNWYKKQRYFLKLIHIETATKELDITKIVAINPWDYGFTHGREVEQLKNTRAICLKSENSTTQKEIEHLFSFIKKKELSPELNEDHIKQIQQIFCYNQGYEGYALVEDKSKSWWIDIFNTFSDMLTEFTAGSINLYKELKAKFKSVQTAPNPVSYVHLFRAVNKYPTYLIDSSLGRSIYYNTRLKLSPRVVRYDDIARGLQNKGPLRDGVYILRLMIVKNDQGKFNGRGAMVHALNQTNDGFRPFLVGLSVDEENAGTRALFSCSADTDKQCITLKDFIMPPTNVPVVIRDGMVKTEVPIYINREHLLFANSKNVLVFQLRPASPKKDSVICKDHNSTCAEEGWGYDTKNLEGQSESWDKAIDWEQTLQKIQPANGQDYDMFFHTYKTPFIPSEWTNWNITHEMHESFDTIRKQYEKYFSLNKRKEEEEYLQTQLERSQQAHDIATAEGAITKTHRWFTKEYLEPTIKYLSNALHHEGSLDKAKAQQITNQLETYKSQIERSQRPDNNKKALIDQIDNILTGEKTIEYLNHKKQNIKENLELSEEQKTLYLNNIDSLIQEIKEEPLMALTFLLPEPVPNKTDFEQEVEHVGSPDPILAQNLEQQNTVEPFVAPSACVGMGGVTGEGDYLKGCSLQVGESTEDLSHKHIEHFATQNTLCTIGISTEELLPKACGQAENVTTDTFLTDLNKQIKIINEVKKEVRELKSSQYRTQSPFLEDNKKLNSHSSMTEAFQKEYKSSGALANKLNSMPNLTTLSAGDLESLIKGASTDPSKYNDKGLMDIEDNKTGSFLHALCGFWFKDFVSSKYSSLDLIEDGLRQTIKESVHYQKQILSQNAEENQTLKDQIIDNLNNIIKTTEDKESKAQIQEFKAHLDKAVQENQATGAIDYFHQWAKGQTLPDTHFNSLLKESLENTLHETPFRYPSLSWQQDKKQVGFNSKYYLMEAVAALKIGQFQIQSLRHPQDEHPFRKCISNPTHFFGLEKKVIVGKVGEDVAYGARGGEITRLNVTESFLMNTQRDQGSNQGFNTNVGLGGLNILSSPALLSLIALKGLIGITPGTAAIAGLLVFSGFQSNMGYDVRVYEGTGKRRWFSIGVVEGVELVSERTPIEIPLKKYHECLVIRPRFNAFELDKGTYNPDTGQIDNYKYEHIWNTESQAIRAIYEKTGLMLCVEGKKQDKKIKEDYYYIYPDYSISSPNLVGADPRSHRNKPFAISLRGRQAYHRFKDSLSCAVSETTEPIKNNEECRNTRGKYENLFSKHIEFADSLEKGFETPKLFHLTGDFPGVYSPYVPKPDRDIKAHQLWYHSVINWFSRYMDLDLEKVIHKEP